MDSIKNYIAPHEKPQKQVKSILVKDYMMPNPVVFYDKQSLIEVVDYLIDKRISGGPVLDKENKLIGIITEADYMRYISNGSYFNRPLNDALVEDYMTKKVDTISPNASLYDAAETFHKLRRKRLIVVENNEFVGQITRKDVIKGII